MMVNTSAGTPLVRPIRPDRLDRGSEPLCSRLEVLGIKDSSRDEVSQAILSMAHLTRSYLEGVRSLLRSGTTDGVREALVSLQGSTSELHDLLVQAGPVLDRSIPANGGDARDLEGLVDVMFRSGGPRELASEGELRNAMTLHLSSISKIRRSDLAHLACLSRRKHL